METNSSDDKKANEQFDVEMSHPASDVKMHHSPKALVESPPSMGSAEKALPSKMQMMEISPEQKPMKQPKFSPQKASMPQFSQEAYYHGYPQQMPQYEYEEYNHSPEQYQQPGYHQFSPEM